jgi:hypothetical protein
MSDCLVPSDDDFDSFMKPELKKPISKSVEPVVDNDAIKAAEAAKPEYQDKPLLTWNDLAKLIEAMPPEKRSQLVLGQNSLSGAYFGYTKIQEVEEGEWDLMPAGQQVLSDDHNWLWVKDGEVKRSRYEPDWEKERSP